MAKAKKPKSKTRKIIEWSVTGFFLVLIGIVAGFKIYQVTSGDHAIFGTQYPVVLTDSMEDVYMVDDVLIVEKVDPSEVKVEDDVSFYYDINQDGQVEMVTHRLSYVAYIEDASLNDGYHYNFAAHGINKVSDQCGGGDCTYQIQEFHEDVLIGKVTGKSQFLRVTNQVFASPITLIVLIVIPALYVIITSVIDLFKTLEENDIDEAKAAQGGHESLENLDASDIERLKKEMLDEMLKKKEKK